MNLQKKHLAIVVILTGFFGMLVYGIFHRIGQSRDEFERIKTFPRFNSYYIDGRDFNTDRIKEGPVLIVFFHPECEHCQYQIGELSKLLPDLPGLNTLFVSHAPVDIVKKFVDDYGIKDSEFSAILSDQSLDVRELFNVNKVPATILYNSQLELVKRYDGEVRIETIMRYLMSDD